MAAVDVGAGGAGDGDADGPDVPSDDPEAYAQWLATVFVKNSPSLMRYFMKRGLCREDARDAVNALFAQLYRRPVHGVRSVSGLLWAAAKFKIADHHRQRARRQSVSIDADERVLDQVSGMGAVGMSLEDRVAMRDAVRRTLSLPQMQMIHAKVVLGLSDAEAAERYGTSVHMVRWHRSEGLQLLRKVYDVQRRSSGRGTGDHGRGGT
ncbi:sigma-70 family RNA polymerase sigma factor [Dactylosporangium sp. NBC_01737]|uniref:RNA polymerase sigma factor n=1 Tax=Dactylosporangium sp. NBC_01737 TaxID=2975959 RepID=UPI002E114022|nr:sigma-70 family RNA polymerase sigma factor [Dactylosporangium sp. NBC_01737]